MIIGVALTTIRGEAMWALELMPFVDIYPLLSVTLATMRTAWPTNFRQDDFRPWTLSEVGKIVNFEKLHLLRCGNGVHCGDDLIPPPPPTGPVIPQRVVALCGAATSEVLVFVFFLGTSVDDDIEAALVAAKSQQATVSLKEALRSASVSHKLVLAPGSQIPMPSPGVTLQGAVEFARAVNESIRVAVKGTDYTQWSNDEVIAPPERVGEKLPLLAAKWLSMINGLGEPTKMILEELK